MEAVNMKINLKKDLVLEPLAQVKIHTPASTEFI
jgi:hypothetical protein